MVVGVGVGGWTTILSHAWLVANACKNANHYFQGCVHFCLISGLWSKEWKEKLVQVPILEQQLQLSSLMQVKSFQK